MSKRTLEAAETVDFNGWLLHADHLTIKTGTDDELSVIKALIKDQITNGYTSFAIDASHLFDFEGGDLEEELSNNIKATTEIANYISDNYKGDAFGLEVEVGEIGRKNESGMVLTTPEEASAFIGALNRNSIEPQVLAIANGSTHGNIYDEHGHKIEQVSINIPQTKAVAEALRSLGSPVRIAQHGITGTPRDLIRTTFPHGDIIKGNVGTFWQNLVFDILKVYEPDLYAQIFKWTIDTHKDKMPGKTDDEIFGKTGKKAIKQFFGEIYDVGEDTKVAIKAESKAQALVFFKAFNSYGSLDML